MAELGTSVVDLGGLDALVHALIGGGYRVLGPTVRDEAVVIDELTSADDLPAGWTDVQDGGTYRLVRRADGALFGTLSAQHSWKGFLLRPRARLWQAEREGTGFRVHGQPVSDTPLAFFGVRSCDLHAIAVQDRVLLQGAFADDDYAARRKGVFMLALNCSAAGGTCFCVSMGTGPRVAGGYDLALTEILDGGHRFVVGIGSARGADVLGKVPHRSASAADRRAAERVVTATAAHMGRTVDARCLRDLLARNLEHPRWDEVATRCLTCANCTMVCPTCFCTAIEEANDLAGQKTERWRVWDSCFSVEYSYVHGGSIRTSSRSRYRQWLTHKFGTWHDQFGTSGCVGCGRCITWCPVAIDVTEELGAIRATEEESDEEESDVQH
jgi:sulfhydrogenase subunit beta (sulfur reductase)